MYSGGEILIDGVNIKDMDTDVLRGAIGQVQQDVFIFTGDIKSNISLRNEEISLEDVKRAAHVVNADTFIEKMPEGMIHLSQSGEVHYPPDNASFCPLPVHSPTILLSWCLMRQQQILTQRQKH